MPTYSELIKLLPYRLRIRFDSLSAYVKGIIDDEEMSMEKSSRLKQKEVKQIQLLVFVSVLDAFFRDGSNAARSAVSNFEALGVEGFSVGNSIFERENSNVQMGDTLSEQLRSAILGKARIDGTAERVFDQRIGMRTLIVRLMQETRRGR